MKFIDTVGFDFPAGTQSELEGSLDTADSVKEIDHSDIEANIQNAPEIIQLKQNLAASKHNKKATEFSLLLPSLSLGASYMPELWAKETKSGTETDVAHVLACGKDWKGWQSQFRSKAEEWSGERNPAKPVFAGAKATQINKTTEVYI